MELDDLKHAWQTLDRRLQQQNALGFQLLKNSRTDNARRGLRPLAWGQALQILIGAAGMLVFAPYWVEHRHETALLLCGLVLHAYCLGLVIVGAVVEARIAAIDYAAPVLAIQRQLLALRSAYVIGGMTSSTIARACAASSPQCCSSHGPTHGPMPSSGSQVEPGSSVGMIGP